MPLTQFPTLPNATRAAQIRRRLVAWFQSAQRDLPWRSQRDPYGTLVSEVMLQQTQVSTVISYFRRFLQRFPDLASLAAASERDVLRLWEGLGYYRRAHHLLQTARRAVAEHGERIPNDPEILSEWPGLGRYMVGAILSQAYDRPLPIIEANSARVWARLFGCREPIASAPVQRWLWGTAEALTPRRGAGVFNQAVMELGALVCKPAKPACDSCPLANGCVAKSRQLQDSIPVRRPASERESIRELACIIYRGRRVLLVQRPSSGRWAGLWEFPHAAADEVIPPRRAIARIVRVLTGLQVRVIDEVDSIQHTFTRFQVTVRCFTARAVTGRFSSAVYPAHAWVRMDELSGYPLSAPHRIIAKNLVTTRKRLP